MLKLKKISIIALLLISIVSISLNVYQYNKLSDRTRNDYIRAKNSMDNHESSFMNALRVPANKPILQYIKSSSNISSIIEQIEESEYYYQEACDYVQDYKPSNRRSGASEHLINLYLADLREYRSSIENGNSKLYNGNVNQTMNDLQVICSWLKERKESSNFTVYTDDDFYNNVYPKLESNIKKSSFFADE